MEKTKKNEGLKKAASIVRYGKISLTPWGIEVDNNQIDRELIRLLGVESYDNSISINGKVTIIIEEFSDNDLFEANFKAEPLPKEEDGTDN